KTALNDAGITYGIDENMLLNICDKPIYDKDIVIANGIEPINGKDGTYKLNFKTEKELRPKEKEDGTVDFYNLEIVENVKKGQILCEITPPTDGKDGMSVTGEIIYSIPGKP